MVAKEATLTCFDVADYFLSLVDEDSGDYISNLKLQKLLYYAQGMHLACFNYPLFNEEIQAWAHGPVIPELYKKYRDYGSNPIPVKIDFDIQKFNDKTKEFLEEVYSIFGQYSAWKLREMSHNEPPYLEAIKHGLNTAISPKSMKGYFLAFVETNA
jgi:uncharacterized phage-associated protein